MAKFTRADIRRIIGENCTDEMEDAIISLHLGVVTPLKETLEAAKEDADKLPTIQKELDDLKAANKGAEEWKLKYDALVQETKENAEKAAKTTALRKLLTSIGISDKRIDSVIKITDLGGIKLTDSGEIEGADKLSDTMKTEWADFITTSETHGAEVETPPTSGNARKYNTRDEILAIKDTHERQAAIASNLDLFNT